MVPFDVIHHFGADKIGPAPLFMTGQTAVHPIVKGDEGDAENTGYLLSGKEGLLAGKVRRATFAGGILQTFFNGLPDPFSEIIFVRNKHSVHKIWFYGRKMS